MENKEFSDSLLTKVYLTKGEHKVSITKHWGWIYLDYLKVTASKETDLSIFQVSKDLINPNADDNTKRLMSFLVDCYGEYVISGQYADNGRYSKEIFAISNASNGNIPAMLGLDLIEYSPSRVENGSSSKAIEYAIEYDSLGGIVTLSWHWNSPSKYLTTKEPWWKGFYKEGTSIDLKKIMKGENKEGYELLVSDIDAIAIQLKKLEDAGVPILFRPLHEASGGWFWWGASGADAYKELWYLLYDRLTNVHTINNLIWVWNGQHKDWYPGDNYVDIMGEDIYPGERVYTSQVGKFNNALLYTSSKKIIALTENGCLFDPDLAFRDDARWAWFATWSGEFVVNSFGALSEKYTEEDMIKKVYTHEKVLTLNELPDLKKYPLEQFGYN
jgi:mannan endo-1,4-beta-mannosidase